MHPLSHEVKEYVPGVPEIVSARLLISNIDRTGVGTTTAADELDEDDDELEEATVEEDGPVLEDELEEAIAEDDDPVLEEDEFVGKMSSLLLELSN